MVQPTAYAHFDLTESERLRSGRVVHGRQLVYCWFSLGRVHDEAVIGRALDPVRTRL
jgi:hypothetical protein